MAEVDLFQMQECLKLILYISFNLKKPVESFNRLFNISITDQTEPDLTYLAHFNTSRLITIFCISLVPSPIVQSLASR